MHLSLRGYLLFLLVVLLGIVGQWSEAIWRDAWRYPAATLVLALLIEAMLVRRSELRVQRRLPRHAALGRRAGAGLLLYNNGASPLRVQVLQPVPAGASGDSSVRHLTLAAGGSDGHAFELLPTALGNLVWDEVYSRILGLFGLAWWNLRLQWHDEVSVQPDLLHRNERNLGLRKTGGYDKRHSGGGGELLFLRDYLPGDSLRNVDWKATARRGKHMVRVYNEEQHLSIALAIDAGRTSGLQLGELSRFHHYVNLAARLAETAVAHGDLVSLVVFADRPLLTLPPARGTPALIKLRQALAASRAVPRESNPLAAADELLRRLRHRSLVVLFTDLDVSDANSQILSVVRLLNRKHLPLIATLQDPALQALAETPATDALAPYQALAAMEMEQTTRATVLRLQHLGACVVRDRAEQLDDAVLGFYQRLRQQRRI